MLSCFGRMSTLRRASPRRKSLLGLSCAGVSAVPSWPRGMRKRWPLAATMVAGLLKLDRSEEHTSELQSLMRISYAVFCLKKKNQHTKRITQSPDREDHQRQSIHKKE